MARERLEAQIAFALEVDRLKEVVRRTWLASRSRRENAAEHSWHAALLAVLLAEWAGDGELDLLRVLEMIVVHDLVEVDAGDTYLYNPEARASQGDREREAADRLFGLLPGRQGDELRALWEEFEARQTPEARFCAAIDRLQPIVLNFASGGAAWRENRVTRGQVERHCRHMAEGSPALWAFAEALLDEAVRRGDLLPREEEP